MKWYVIPPLIICGLNSMLAAIVLCLAVFHLLTDKSTNAPIEPNEEWISLVKWLAVFSTFWLILSIAGMYVCMARRQTWRATVILVLYALCFGISVYFNVSFGNQLDMKEVGSDILFKKTVQEISDNRGDTWIPGWLDNVQKQSKVCCGIMTYRDYEEFWPSTPSRIPRSCCKDSKTLPSPCPSDLNLIPFPNTPGDFAKVEMGCMQEILEAVRHHIRESYQNSVIMTVFIVCGILAYLVLYTKRYLEGVEDAAAQQQKENAQGGGDSRDFDVTNGNQNAILNTGSGPLLITSSGQMGGSIDSFEGIPMFGSMDSFPVQSGGFPVRQYIPDQAQLQMQYRQQQMAAQMQSFQGQPVQVPLPIIQQQQAFQAMRMQQLPQQWQMPQQSQQPTGPMLNKGNVAIAGLQQQMLQQQQQDQQLQQQDANKQQQFQLQNDKQFQLQNDKQQFQQQNDKQFQLQNDKQQFQQQNDKQFQLQNDKQQFQRQNDKQFQLQNDKQQLQMQNDKQFQLQNDKQQFQQQNDKQFQLQNDKQQFQMQNDRQFQLQNDKQQFQQQNDRQFQLQNDKQQFQIQNQGKQQQFQIQNPNQQQQFQQQKLQQLQQQQLQSPQILDTSIEDNNIGIVADGGNVPQREAYVPISGPGKSTEQSNQIPNMGRNFMQPLLPMGNSDLGGNDNNIARMEQQQQTQDAAIISPPGSPTGRRKKVRKEALANRNNK